MAIEFDIRTEGLSDFSVRFRAMQDYRDEVFDATNQAGRAAMLYAKRKAPEHTGKLKGAIKKEEPVFKPGGAGGGGFWTVKVFVDPEEAPHGAGVLGGTGEHGPFHRPIYPKPGFVPAVYKKGKHKGKYAGRRLKTMRFHPMDKLGEEAVFARTTAGQEPNTGWWTGAQKMALTTLSKEIKSI